MLTKPFELATGSNLFRSDFERGELSLLLDWLRQRVHRQGFRLDAEQLIEQVTGQGLTDADFLAHVKAKYGALYGVALG